MITFRCPNAQCPKTFSVKDEFAGKKTKCPTCGALIVVPIPQKLHPEPSQRSDVIPVVSTPSPVKRSPAVSVPAVDVAAARSHRKAGRRMHGTARALWDRATGATKIGVICGAVVLLLGFGGVALMIATRDRSSPQKQAATASRSKETGSTSSTPEDAFRLFVQAVQGDDVARAFALDALPRTRLSGKFKDEIDAMKREYARHFEGSPSRYSGEVGTPRITGWPIQDLGESSLVSDIRLLIPKGCTYEISDIVYSEKPVNEYQREAARLLIEVQYSAENHLVYVNNMRAISIPSGRGPTPMPAVFAGDCILKVDDPFFSVREYSSEYDPHKRRLEYDRKDIKRAVLEVVALKIDGSWLIGQHTIFLVDDSGRRSREGRIFLDNTRF